MLSEPSRPHATERVFVTPEGMDLRLNIADASQRAAAFLFDAMIIIMILVAFTILALFMGIGSANVGGFEIVAVIWLLFFFLLRNFYFTAFELSAAAATPGKRLFGLRVAARDGGQLRAEAVFARNAMRELEVFLPLSMLINQTRGGGADGWIWILGLVWASLFVFFPLFNRDRLRAGDLVGGTWVVRTPRRKLMGDMADAGAERLDRFVFTQAQLDVYGARELHVLETVLRKRDRKAMRAVADRIAIKISWPVDASGSGEDFLSAYYAALRGRLEQRLLMGVRRKDKFDI